MTDWRCAAACRDHPHPDLWYGGPDQGWSSHINPAAALAVHTAAVTEAKTICRGCPVRMPCLLEAIALLEDEGVWGGLDAGERQQFAALRRSGITESTALALLDAENVAPPSTGTRRTGERKRGQWAETYAGWSAQRGWPTW